MFVRGSQKTFCVIARASGQSGNPRVYEERLDDNPRRHAVLDRPLEFTPT
jgi:hypothetical protein